MPGASSKRGRSDKKNRQPRTEEPASGQGGEASTPHAAQVEQPAPPAGFDGPAPSAGGASSRGQQQDVGAESVRSGSAAPKEEKPPRDPAKDQPAAIFNRNVDFAANAYNLISEVSQIFISLLSSFIAPILIVELHPHSPAGVHISASSTFTPTHWLGIHEFKKLSYHRRSPSFLQHPQTYILPSYPSISSYNSFPL